MIWEYLANIGAVITVVLVVGFCIFSHELGHFLAGKWRKLHIDAFSVGFRKIWWKKVNGVEYRIGWIPLGGYVELPQVDAADNVIKAADGTVLPRAKPLDRIITAAAGPLANILCGMVLACVVWYFGIPQDSPEMHRMQVTKVEQDSPEYRAGLRPGDVITRLNGEDFNCTWMKFAERIMYTVGPVRLDIERNGTPLALEYTPVDNPHAPGRLGREKIGYPFFSVHIPLELRPLAGEPADRAGIRSGDILLEVDGRSVSSAMELRQQLCTAEKPVVIFTVQRKDAVLNIPVEPEPVPGTEAMYKIGIYFQESTIPTVDLTIPGSAADRAGLQAGDVIRSIDAVPMTTREQMIETVNSSGGKTLRLTAEREGKVLEFDLTPQKLVPRTAGVDLLVLAHPSPFAQFSTIVRQTYFALRGMFFSSAHQLGLTEKTSTLKLRHMSSIVGIGNVLYNMFRRAPVMMALHFVVVFMFALAIFNLLPLPVLDGGHIAFALIEIVFRKPLPARVIKALSSVFIGLLVLLMLYVTYFDVLRLLPVSKGGGNTHVHTETQKP